MKELTFFDGDLVGLSEFTGERVGSLEGRGVVGTSVGTDEVLGASVRSLQAKLFACKSTHESSMPSLTSPIDSLIEESCYYTSRSYLKQAMVLSYLMVFQPSTGLANAVSSFVKPSASIDGYGDV